MKFSKVCVANLILPLIFGGCSMNSIENQSWDKTFVKSEKVGIKKVSFKNRYGITLVGDLYIPKNISGKL